MVRMQEDRTLRQLSTIVVVTGRKSEFGEKKKYVMRTIELSGHQASFCNLSKKIFMSLLTLVSQCVWSKYGTVFIGPLRRTTNPLST
jgi:hypothetical protein